MTRWLRLAALGVMGGVLVLFVASLQEWSNMQVEIPRFDPHDTRSLIANKWILSVLFFPALLLNGLGISLLLLSAAARIAASREDNGGQGPIGGDSSATAGLLSQLPNPVAMKGLATVLLLYCLFLLVFSVANPWCFGPCLWAFR